MGGLSFDIVAKMTLVQAPLFERYEMYFGLQIQFVLCILSSFPKCILICFMHSK